MKIIGLTGPTGAGKTTACATFSRLGAGIINADECARAVTQKGAPVLKLLAEEFGGDIIISGELDRRELARRAFATPERTARLNEIIFPFIKEHIKGVITEMKGKDVVVLDAPTLFESGCDAMCDTTLAILSKEENRLPRIIRRDGLSESDAAVRLGAAKEDDFYISRAKHIIYNDAADDGLIKEIERFYRKI